MPEVLIEGAKCPNGHAAVNFNDETGKNRCGNCGVVWDHRPGLPIVALECPRGNQAHKQVFIHPDEHHTRECITCAYTWRWRPGMPLFAGEVFGAETVTPPPAEPMAPETAPVVTGEAETAAATTEAAAETAAETQPETPAEGRHHRRR